MNRVLATLNSIWGGLTNGAQSLAQQMSLVPAYIGHTYIWLAEAKSEDSKRL